MPGSATTLCQQSNWQPCAPPDDGHPCVVRLKEQRLGAQPQRARQVRQALPVAAHAVRPAGGGHIVLHIRLALLQQQQAEALHAVRGPGEHGAGLEAPTRGRRPVAAHLRGGGGGGSTAWYSGPILLGMWEGNGVQAVLDLPPPVGWQGMIPCCGTGHEGYKPDFTVGCVLREAVDLQRQRGPRSTRRQNRRRRQWYGRAQTRCGN